ncbi:MAG: MBOAT family O-acyltransferase [Bacteroidota bacterium]
MLYNTLEFSILYIAVFLLYWFATNKNLRAQNMLILVASYIFYGWWDWRFLSLVLGSSLTDYFVANQISEAESPAKKKAWLYLSLAVNLGLLGVFKYYGFFVDSFIDMFQMFGYELNERSTSIVLPVGISFYTFQTLSYTIDVYRGRFKATKEIVPFLAFVSFFPQLIAGPIERASNLLPQFFKQRKFDLQKAKDGLRQILWGLFKKVVIADTLGMAVDNIIGYHTEMTGSVLAMGILFFAIQLYCDFSGYSDMAIGTARLLGFKLMRNFNYPFFARDMLDFWRRWHISLTTWFKDYVFLSLSKGKMVSDKWIIVRNYILTFTVSGLWHGANWTFVIWGLLHGIFQVPYLIWPQLRSKIQQTRPPFNFYGTLRAAFQMGLTLVLNLLALVFFFSESVSHAMSYFSQMFSSSLFSLPNIYRKELYWLLLFMGVEWIMMYRKKVFPLQIAEWHPVLRWGVYYSLTLVILYFNYDRRAFVYFQF